MRQMHLVAFLQAPNCTTLPASWRHPEARTDTYVPEYSQHMVRVLEAGKFDIGFFDDRLAMPDRYDGDHAHTIQHGIRCVKMDPIPCLMTMAAVTTRLCTNSANAGAVLGAAVREWRGLDLADAHGTMRINGEQVGQGRGADVMGHPLEPLVWLANLLAKRGNALRAGMTVITGSIITPKPVKAGDTATIAIDGLGEAQVTVS
jgi:hypothetical protein